MSRNVLVAPLNWGLGHATRCIPIIKALEQQGFAPIIASDGEVLMMLRKEFPQLQSLELPSYRIEYPKNGVFFKLKMLANLPKMLGSIAKEKKRVRKWVEEYNLIGIISDNRFGVMHPEIPSVYITHQLNVLSGSTTAISGKMHRNTIEKFTECWVPDWEDKPNLSGRLGHLRYRHPKIKYIGPLSRFEKKELPKKYDLMVVLSGPEPQRGMLESQLRKMLSRYDGKVIFICGKVEAEHQQQQIGNITFHNFLQTEALENAFNESEIVLCRSGYTTIMDLAKLDKKAYFIPTPGQPEQEYLARRLKRDGLAPYSKQENFRIEFLPDANVYEGLPNRENQIDWNNLFALFERK